MNKFCDLFRSSFCTWSFNICTICFRLYKFRDKYLHPTSIHIPPNQMIKNLIDEIRSLRKLHCIYLLTRTSLVFSIPNELHSTTRHWTSIIRSIRTPRWCLTRYIHPTQSHHLWDMQNFHHNAKLPFRCKMANIFQSACWNTFRCNSILFLDR